MSEELEPEESTVADANVVSMSEIQVLVSDIYLRRSPARFVGSWRVPGRNYNSISAFRQVRTPIVLLIDNSIDLMGNQREDIEKLIDEAGSRRSDCEASRQTVEPTIKMPILYWSWASSPALQRKLAGIVRAS